MEYGMQAGLGTPDWVMCGCPLPDGRVQLVASRELTHAELTAEWNYREVWDAETLGPDELVMETRRITLAAGVRTFVVIEADSYATAFRTLFEQWQPGPGERPAIGGPGQLEAGPGAV